MRGELVLSISTLLGFFLTLIRVGGVFVFVPIPGINSVLSPARVVLALGMTLTLFPEWPKVNEAPSAPLFVMWVLVEAALGAGVGLTVAFIVESFSFSAQLIGLQAGYGFATTIDPDTQANSTVLILFAQLTTGLLFFATGLHRDILRVFAVSLETWPAGTFVLSRGAAEQVLGMGATMLGTGLRLALPVIAVLAMVDISLALLGRVNAQLHLITVAFPVKMLTGIALLSALAVLMPTLFRAETAIGLHAMGKLIAR